MNKFILVGFLLLVTSCATPATVLKNEKTGQVVTCGGTASGSLAGGYIGYSIQKSNDADCVINYVKEGFKPVSPR